MPYATNPIDGIRTYFEDSGGDGAPVLVYPGFTDSIAYAKGLPVVQALQQEFRLIYGDHRGMGRSDKPHDPEAYDLQTRVGDVTAVLDTLGIDRAHYFGSSWGSRLGFAAGEHAAERLRALVLYGNQPYEWPRGALMQGVLEALAVGAERGMPAMVESWEASIGQGFRFPEPGRTLMLDNDPIALNAAFISAMREGPISKNLASWRLPCLIYVGTEDEMRPGAERAAKEIPGARFISIPAETHFSAEWVAGELLPLVREVLRSA